ncbi:MAG: ribonuclease HII [Chloroflexi bacterium]|nr:ribonuclease HII [Chloroflexota bacterium]
MSWKRPTWVREQALWAQGMRWVAGVDEAGRGAWAGPVTAAAVVFPPEAMHVPELACVRDSKQLTPTQRLACSQVIKRWARAWGLGWASPREIETIGIGAATRRAMHRALAGLSLQVDAVLIDHVTLPGPWYWDAFPRGDQLVISIAAASILAKVSRDAYMRAMSVAYPGYGFEQHKGYGTQQHRVALARQGPSPLHRRTFRPVMARLALGRT